MAKEPPKSNADRQREHRAKQAALLARAGSMEKALHAIRDELAATKTTKGLALRKLAEDALA